MEPPFLVAEPPLYGTFFPVFEIVSGYKDGAYIDGSDQARWEEI
jgi:hypothetical protein